MKRVICLLFTFVLLGGCSKSYEFTLTEKPTRGYENGYEWVDLGLSVKWASCNIGAAYSSDYGEYIAWGDIYEKSSYYDDNCKTSGVSYSNLPYLMDAARERWGGKWRMPTRENVRELVNKCSWRWTSRSGVSGYECTGPNGNKIFFPAGGLAYGLDVYDECTSGYFWTATPTQEDGEWKDKRSYMFYYNRNDDVEPASNWCVARRNGLNIRPVMN